MRRVDTSSGLHIELIGSLEMRTVKVGARIEGMVDLLHFMGRFARKRSTIMDIRSQYISSGLHIQRYLAPINAADPTVTHLKEEHPRPLFLPIEHAPSVVEAVSVVSQLRPTEAFLQRVSSNVARGMLAQYWQSTGHEDN